MDVKAILKAKLKLAKENVNDRERRNGNGIYVMFSYFQLFVVLVLGFVGQHRILRTFTTSGTTH